MEHGEKRTDSCIHSSNELLFTWHLLVIYLTNGIIKQSVWFIDFFKILNQSIASVSLTGTDCIVRICDVYWKQIESKQLLLHFYSSLFACMAKGSAVAFNYFVRNWGFDDCLDFFSRFIENLLYSDHL